jgi:hypothetical protein
MPVLKPGGEGPTDPLSLIPAGEKYAVLRAALAILKRDFPQKYEGLTKQPQRVLSWLQKEPDQARDDIFQYIIGEQLLMDKYGVDEATAEKIILGGNEGGVNLSDVIKQTPDKFGVSPGEGKGKDTAPVLRIMKGNIRWYKDRKSGLYYVEYTLPNNAGTILFEAEQEQIQEIFGRSVPTGYTLFNFEQHVGQDNVYYGGNVAEVEGDGDFGNEVRRVTALALDQEDLPDWLRKDQKALDLLYVKVAENRSNEWFWEQVSRLPSYKAQYPGIEKLIATGLDRVDAQATFNEYEIRLKRLHSAAGYSPDAISRGTIGALITKGYSIDQVTESYSVWKRLNDHAPALEAFNQILVASGQKALSGVDMYKFLTGQAPAEIYDLYEASYLREAAAGSGLGDIFSAEEAIDLASFTAENLNVNSAYEAFRDVASQALRFRHELDVGQYGLDVDDLIDLSFGRPPRSGKDAAEVGEVLARITQAAQAARGGRINPFIGFTPEGRPQARSLSGLRATTI